jgi:A/G-specific adenine glycosylase
MTEPALFAERLLAWYDRHGRHDLPWQHPRSAYRVWIAEVMLQQTQVATVRPYFERFVARFPDLPSLAGAEQDEVLAHWSGLGYYSRARNLHASARLCVERHGGELPRELDTMTALPGIGRSTAAAILAQAHGDRHAILDGNVKRLLCRLHAIEGWPGSPAVEKTLWPLAERLLPTTRLADYTQAIMDFGATLCTRSQPDCGRCPLIADCRAHREQRVTDLPSPRPAKRLPERRCLMLMLRHDDGRLLLQRRPPVGVWATLWSLPEFDSRDALDAFARRAQPLGEARTLPAFTHVFSHYRLRIEPLHWGTDNGARVDQSQSGRLQINDNPDLRWCAADELGALGLPAPVRRLLESAFEENT